MNKFFWRILFCVLPLLIAGWIVGTAINNYVAGRGGFKLGVDLVGGTILIYEIDPEKMPPGWDLRQAQELATRLKSRIDPGDLYNITIRVVSNTRFEIILPTGGKHQIDAQNKIWKDLVTEVEKIYPVRGYRIPTGQTKELLAEVTAQYQDEWAKKGILDEKITDLTKFINDEYANKAAGKKDLEKENLWGNLLVQLQEKYPATHYEAGPNRDGDLIKLVQGQYPVEQFTAPVGKIDELAAVIVKSRPKDSAEKITKFLKDNFAAPKEDDKDGEKKAWDNLLALANETYGKIDQKRIVEVLNPGLNANGSKGGKGQRGAMNQEEVQQRKNEISQQGSLEFRIIANQVNDKDAMDDAKRWFDQAKTDPEKQKELIQWAEQGQIPQIPNPDQPYQIELAKQSYRVRYAWLELGQEFRREHGLANPRDSKGLLIPLPPVAGKGKEKDPDFIKKLELWEKEHKKAWDEAIRTPDSILFEEAARFRNDGDLMPFNGQNGMRNSGSWGDTTWLYSREAINPRLSDKDREKKIEYFVLTRIDPDQIVTGDMVSSASPGMQDRVDFTMKDRYSELFRSFTSANIKHVMVIVLDGKLESAATINDAISSRGVITLGKAPLEKLNFTVKVLRSGSLPATLKQEPVSESTMGPTLGADTIYSGSVSVIAAFLAVLVFMLVYYRFAGLVACIALLANLLLTVAFMLMVGATFTLPGLAGLVLMLGMAVDANVLIYERLREERERGASISQALRNGYEHALPTIIDTHLSSIFTAVVLYVVGNDQLKGFGISLTVGLVISLFTSLFMTRVIFDLWESQGWLKNLSMFKLLSNPKIDFMAIRYPMFALTTILTILGASLFIYRLDRGGLNIDFVGGVSYTGELKEPRDLKELRDKLDDPKIGLYDPSIEQIFLSDPSYTQGTKSRLFTVRVALDPNLSDDQRRPENYVNLVQNKINKALGEEGAGWLKTTHLTLEKSVIEPNNKEVYLTFTEPGNDNKENLTFASKAQVAKLLGQELEDKGLRTEAKQFIIQGLGKDRDGRFQWMKVIFPKPVSDTASLKSALEATQKAFTRPLPEQLENFDSQLAQDTQLRALYAILASWGAILLYLWFRFGNWTFGLAAVLCLIHDLFFTLGAIAACHYIFTFTPSLARTFRLGDFRIDLPTVAALLTLVGYSVNDTIVVFDRIREVRGKNPFLTPEMINTSVNQTLSRTLLTSFVTWLVVLVLFIWGGEGLHLFAFVMVVGVLVGTYSSIYIAAPLLLMFGEGRPESEQRTSPSLQKSGSRA